MAAATPTILDLDLSHERSGRVLEDIARLEKIIFPEHSSPARSLGDELKRPNSGLIYSTPGAADGEEVAGYAAYTCNTSLCATIIELAVRESCRRQGHGEALLRAAVERCRGRRVQRVILHIDPARTAAVALYRKAGFQLPSRRHRRGILRAAEGRLPDVRGSSVNREPIKQASLHEKIEFACQLPFANEQ